MTDRLRSRDPHRPRYHVTPAENWLNDPNGLIRWNGTYHVFYQHNPNEPRWGDIHWGHATSDDLVSWEDRPIALAPEAGIDGDGCFSGCAIDDDGTPTLVYTGVEEGVQRQCLATSTDPDLEEWEKEGVVLADPPGDATPSQFRDPHVWREDGTWRMLLGTRIDGEAAIVGYRSPDLREWEYEGVVHAEPDREGVLECPGLVRFPDADLLFYSTMDDRSVVVLVGESDGGRFVADDRTLLDGGAFYAPQVTRDGSGRPLLWGWVTESRPEEAQVEAGWSGALSLPRVLTLENGSLRQRPADELRGLRREGSHHDLAVAGEQPLDRAGRSLEMEATIRPGPAREVGVSVLRDPSSGESTDVLVDREGSELRVEPAGDATPERAPLPSTEGPTTLRIFVDGSVIEAFVEGRTALTARTYPDEEGRAIAALADGGTNGMTMSVWELASIRS